MGMLKILFKLAIISSPVILVAILLIMPESPNTAEVFCKDNGMELKSYINQYDYNKVDGLCVIIIDNTIIETKNITWVQGIKDWRFAE